MQKYAISNPWNCYTEQLYPITIYDVEYVDFIAKKFPYGCIQIHCNSVDGYYSSGLLKCYLSKKGKFTIWGKHRIYVGYQGPLELIGVPFPLRESVNLFAKQYGSIVE